MNLRSQLVRYFLFSATGASASSPIGSASQSRHKCEWTPLDSNAKRHDAFEFQYSPQVSDFSFNSLFNCSFQFFLNLQLILYENMQRIHIDLESDGAVLVWHFGMTFRNFCRVLAVSLASGRFLSKRLVRKLSECSCALRYVELHIKRHCTFRLIMKDKVKGLCIPSPAYHKGS